MGSGRTRPTAAAVLAAARQAALLGASPAIRPWASSPDHAERLARARRLVPGNLLQVSEELVGFAEFASQRHPVRIAEIGTYNGGTSLFLCGLCGSVREFVGVDLTPHNDRLVSALAPRSVTVTFLRGSSRDPLVVEQLAAAFDGQPIDLLFLDGDHTYDGVRADLLTYRPLVRAGGLIAFHDIVSDHGARGGPPATGWVGDVPVLWREIRERFPHWEFVKDWEQDGAGIGVIEHDPSVRL